jgi:hypothetical protein
MAKIKASDLKRERSALARTLTNFAQILLEQAACQDASPIHAAASQCLNETGYMWGYTVGGLTLHVPPGSFKCFPAVLSKHGFICRIDIAVRGRLFDQEGADPLEKHQLQVVVSVSNPATGETFLHPWHVDRHVGDVDAADAAHPRYHLSFGGHELEGHLTKMGGNLPGVVFLDAPRIAMPPMDLVLAVDFVLSHFCGVVWRKLRESPLYQNCVSDSQRKLWRPYAMAISAYWAAGGIVAIPPRDLWPNLR